MPSAAHAVDLKSIFDKASRSFEENVGRKVEETFDNVFGNEDQPAATQDQPPPASSQPQGAQQPPSPGPQYTVAEVRETQRLLTELGYNPGPVDGVYGSKTLRAILAFETDRRLPPTGVPSPGVIAHMRTAAAGGPQGAPDTWATTAPEPSWSAPTEGSPLPAAPTAEAAYPDFVHLALRADPAAFAAEREVAGVAYRLAVMDEPACRQLVTRLAQMAGDAFLARDFALESAAVLDEALADLDATPPALEVLLSDQVHFQTYDFAAGGYPLSATPLLRGGKRSLTDRISAPPCDAGVPLHHALPKEALTISRVGLGTLSVELEGAPGVSILPMADSDARAFEARNARRLIELVGHVRLEPPEAAFGPLRGRVLALEARDPDTGDTLYRFPLAPEVAEAPDPRAPGYQPEYADFVHLALMSDLDAYLAEAGATGLAVIAATGDERECRRVYDVARSGDEFALRDLQAEAAARFRELAGTLEARPRRFETSIEATYRLDTYDFDREGFPFSQYQNAKQPILAPGVVKLPGDERPAFCRGLASGMAPGLAPAAFIDLGAEHQGVPDVAFLPMPPEQARTFRSAGKGTVVLRAALVVEPRAQGRGPLAGRIAALSAHDPETGDLLHRFDLQPPVPAAGAQGGPIPWTAELAAALLGPVVEPAIADAALDSAAVNYFRRHKPAIDQGNPPPGSPLPIEVMRNQTPEVMVALNRDRLRAALRERTLEIPVAVALEEEVSGQFREGRGLILSSFEGHKWLISAAPDAADPRGSATLSSRQLPLYPKDSLLQTDDRAPFRAKMLSSLHLRPALELDRFLHLEPIAASIELAASRGFRAGYGPYTEPVIVRWELDVLGARMDGQTPVISARLTNLSFRWSSDNAPLASVEVAALPSATALQAAEAAAQAQAEAEEAERERRAAEAAQARLDAILGGRTGLLLIRHADADRVTQVLVQDEGVAKHYRTLVLVNGLDLPSQARVQPQFAMTAHFLRNSPGAAVVVDSDVFARELFDLVADLDLEGQTLDPDGPAPAERQTEPPPSTAQATTLQTLAPGDAQLLLLRPRGDAPIERVFEQNGVNYGSQMREVKMRAHFHRDFELVLDLPERAQTIDLDEAPEVLRLASGAAVVLQREGLETIWPQISDLDLVAIRFPIEEYQFGIPKDHTKGADAFAILGITGGMDEAAALEELNWTFASEEIVREPAGDAVLVSRGACDSSRATEPATAAEIGAYCLTLGLADGMVTHVALRQVVEGDAADVALAAFAERYGRSQRFREVRHLERGARRIVVGWGEALNAQRDQLGRVSAKSPPAVLEAVVWVVDGVSTILLHLDDMPTVAEVKAAEAPEIKF